MSLLSEARRLSRKKYQGISLRLPSSLRFRLDSFVVKKRREGLDQSKAIRLLLEAALNNQENV